MALKCARDYSNSFRHFEDMSSQTQWPHTVASFLVNPVVVFFNAFITKYSVVKVRGNAGNAVSGPLIIAGERSQAPHKAPHSG